MMRVLVLNTGSSSVKWAVLGADETVLAGGNEAWVAEDSAGRAGQLRVALKQAPAFDAVGHRVVHGGTRFREAVVIDERVRGELAGLTDLDPEHMQASLAGIDAVSAAFPTVPQVAAFDTAFHATMPEAAAGYGLPFEWTERWGLRRFGFHGLSVAYAVERANELLVAPPSRLIVCHLGGGCSVTAVEGGRSVDTTMGFSPLEGLMMTTRSGSVDPGVLLYLQQHCEVGIEELRETLTKRSGLRGVSGVSGDLREVLEAADSGSSRARLAYERFVLSIRRALGAMAGVLGGVDTVVFTGGIGENSERVRREATSALRFAGLELAEDADASSNADRDISAPASRVRVLVVRAREDLTILKEVLRLRQAEPPGGDSKAAGRSCTPTMQSSSTSRSAGGLPHLMPPHPFVPPCTSIGSGSTSTEPEGEPSYGSATVGRLDDPHRALLWAPRRSSPKDQGASVSKSLHRGLGIADARVGVRAVAPAGRRRLR